MYKVSEVAKNIGVTVAGVYKAIKQLDKRYINKIDGVTYIDDAGYDVLKRRFEDSKGQKQGSKLDDVVVVSLLKQLEEKDRQIMVYKCAVFVFEFYLEFGVYLFDSMNNRSKMQNIGSG